MTADLVTAKLDVREAAAKLPEEAENTAESADPDIDEPIDPEEQE